MRQALNTVRIEGILSEINLRYSTFERNGETKEAVGGTVKILVDQIINGEQVALEIPVHMFSTKYTRAGGLNPAYESIEKCMKEFVSIASCGSKEQADKVRINGDITSNDFIGQNGVLVSNPRIRANFISHAIGDFEPQANFSVEFVAAKIDRAVDSEGVELDPPKGVVEAIIPQYGGRVDVVKMYAYSPAVIDAIEQYWEVGGSFRASGRLNFSSTTQTVLEEVGFGEPQKRQRTVNVSELIITGGSQAPLEEEFAFDINEIKEAVAQRKQRIEDMKANGANRKAPVKTAKGKVDLGF